MKRNPQKDKPVRGYIVNVLGILNIISNLNNKSSNIKHENNSYRK